jgi:DNA polymerase V
MKKQFKDIEILGVVSDSKKAITFIENFEASAGFPSPSEDYLETRLDLNELIDNPDSSYIIRIKGDSMIDDNLESGDYIVVDGLKRPNQNTTSKNFLVYIPSEGHTVKGIKQSGSIIELMPRNANFPTQKFDLEQMSDIRVWGGVTWVFKKKW